MGVARARREPARVRRAVDRRDGALEARRAQAARRPARGPAARRAAGARPVRARARAHDPLDPRLVRGGAEVRARHDRAHRRLQVRPDAGRRDAGRRLAAGRARPRRRAAAVRRLDQRRPSRVLAVRARRRAAPAGGVRARQGADRRDQLRLEHPPRPAGDRRGRRARAQGVAGRTLDAQEREHRTVARPHRVPRGDADPAPGGRGLARREDRRDLDRVPGRAAVGAAADGAQRSPDDQAPPRRHRRVLGDADPGQRARGQRDRSTACSTSAAR